MMQLVLAISLSQYILKSLVENSWSSTMKLITLKVHTDCLNWARITLLLNAISQCPNGHIIKDFFCISERVENHTWIKCWKKKISAINPNAKVTRKKNWVQETWKCIEPTIMWLVHIRLNIILHINILSS